MSVLGERDLRQRQDEGAGPKKTSFNPWLPTFLGDSPVLLVRPEMRLVNQVDRAERGTIQLTVIASMTGQANK